MMRKWQWYEFGAVLRIRIRMYLGLPDPDPDPLVRCTDPDPSSDLLQSSKNSKKNLNSLVLWLLCVFLSLNKKYGNKQRNVEIFFPVVILKVTDENTRIR